MDAIVRQYKLNVYLLSSIGLWPYAGTKIRRIQNIVVSTLLWLGLVIQFGVFGPFKHTVELVLRNASFILGALCFLFKYCSFWFQIGTVKHVMEQIKHDWETLKVEEELGIIKEHARMGAYCTRFFALMVYPSALAFILVPFASDFLNVVAPLNKSRQHQFPITTGTILDEEKYFYVLVSCTSIVILAGVTTLIATEGIFFAWLQHAAATFEIVSYRLREIVVPDSVNMDLFSSKSEIRAFANIIDIHRRAIKFFNYLKRSFSPSYFVLCGVGVAGLSIHLFRLSQLVESLTDVGELFFSCSIVISSLIYLYYLNYSIAQTIGFSNNIFTDALSDVGPTLRYGFKHDLACRFRTNQTLISLKRKYNIRWYETPVATQKMLIIMMQGNVKSISFDLYGFCNCSIEGFGMLVRLSVSYFMALRSIS